MPNRQIIELDANNYWREPDPLPESVHFWEDLDSAQKGMVSSDQIRAYVDELQLIHPFDEAQLKPASYDLTLGPLYQFNGRNRVLTSANPVLEIPPNSIVFVAMGERLMLPHYLIGRFDLQIPLIYKGLLLGTGPQVDPGFRGVLSCPLHNISESSIFVQLGEQIAKIDFEKTGGWPAAALQLLKDRSIETDEAMYSLRDDLRQHGVVLFDKSKRWKRPITDYAAGQMRVRSSIARLERTVTAYRNFGVGAIIAALIAIAGLTIEAANLVASATKAVTDSSKLMSDTSTQNQQLAGQVKDLTARLDQLAEQQAGLGQQVEQLRGQGAPRATPAP